MIKFVESNKELEKGKSVWNVISEGFENRIAKYGSFKRLSYLELLVSKEFMEESIVYTHFISLFQPLVELLVTLFLLFFTFFLLLLIAVIFQPLVLPTGHPFFVILYFFFFC